MKIATLTIVDESRHPSVGVRVTLDLELSGAGLVWVARSDDDGSILYTGSVDDDQVAVALRGLAARMGVEP